MMCILHPLRCRPLPLHLAVLLLIFLFCHLTISLLVAGTPRDYFNLLNPVFLNYLVLVLSVFPIYVIITTLLRLKNVMVTLVTLIYLGSS